MCPQQRYTFIEFIHHAFFVKLEKVLLFLLFVKFSQVIHLVVVGFYKNVPTIKNLKVIKIIKDSVVNMDMGNGVLLTRCLNYCKNIKFRK